MKKSIVLIIVLLLAVLLIVWGVLMMKSQDDAFQVTSTDIQPNTMLSPAQVYNAHGCSGQNISPELSWSNAPTGTKSFAIICHDPDAPREHGWYHWLVVNIPSHVSEIKTGGNIPGALSTMTDFKENAYGGACPPVGHGVHHYNFTVYALNTEKLDVSAQTAPTEVEKVVKQHALAQATLTGLYERK